MKMTLGQLVEGALSEADQQLKLASAADVHLPSGDSAIKIAMDDMAEGDDEDKKKARKKDEDDDEEEEKTSALEDAAYAQELVEALGHIQVMFPKLASEMQTFKGQHNVGDTTKDSTTKPKTVSQAVASHGGGSSEAVDGGSRTGIETNEADYASPDWTGNPEAGRGAIRTSGPHPSEEPHKTASLRQALAHQSMLLKAAGAKFAQDPSSPQPTNLPKSENPGKMDHVPGGTRAIPDNQGMINMTKRQAKTQFVKNDAGKVLREPAFDASTDKALRDNLSMGLETAKIAAGTPIAHDEKFQGRLSAGILGTQGAILGAGLGGAAAEALGKHPGIGMGVGGALGALAGGVGGRALGRWGARKEKEMDEAKAEMAAQKMLEAQQAAQAGKTSGIKLAAQRALLTKIATGQFGTEKQAAFHRALEAHRRQKLALNLSAGKKGISAFERGMAQGKALRKAQLPVPPAFLGK